MCTYIFPDVIALAASKNFAVWASDWPNSIQWARLDEKSGAFAPQGDQVSLYELKADWYLPQGPPSLLNLHVNNSGMMLVELEYACKELTEWPDWDWNNHCKMIILYSLPHRIMFYTVSGVYSRGRTPDYAMYPLLLRPFGGDQNFIVMHLGSPAPNYVDLEVALDFSLRSGRPWQGDTLFRNIPSGKERHLLGLRDGVSILTTERSESGRYRPDEWKYFEITDLGQQPYTRPFSATQGIFPSKPRGPLKIHAMTGSNLFAIQTTLKPTSSDRSEYQIYEIWYKNRLQKPVRERVRVIHIQWPESDIAERAADDSEEEFQDDFDEDSNGEPIEQPYDSGTLFHEAFTRLTVVQDKVKEETNFCHLLKSVPPPEVAAQLDGNLSLIDEYYTCDAMNNEIGTLLNTEAEKLAEFGVASDGGPIKDVRLADGGLLQLRRRHIWNKTMASDQYLLKFVK
ncbi:hypothetical protein BJY04DRAFT_154900 [Aspergillus karnatakaensis]|uniref:uncharacterized protein n=1 Tax=Aspergillus karnatakaensis TaxID=1810916 RepID=UPI003CCDA4CF